MIFKVQTLPNLPGKQFRTTMVQEIDENRFRRRLGERFFRSGSLFCRFWGPTWLPDWPLWTDFRPTFATFWPTVGQSILFFARGGCWDRFWSSRGPSQDGFWEDFGSFSALLRSFVASQFCSNFVPSLSKFQISPCSAVGALP